MGGRSIGWLGAVALFTALLGGGFPGASAISQPATPDTQPLFTWSVPSRFTPDAFGRLHDTQPEDVRRGPWRVTLEVKSAPCSGAGIYHWFVDGKPIHPDRTVGCAFTTEFPREATYSVRLVARVGGRTFRETQRVRVKDFLIVSIGDSIGSGEAVPDVPGLHHARWNSARCHRSGRASPAKSAARIEADDPHSSVTFVHLACSGATVPEGLLGRYAGAEPPPDEPPLPSQVGELEQVATRRQIDAVIVNVGANDTHFSAIVKFCATRTGPNCFDAAFGGRTNQTTAEVVKQALSRLPARYRALARRLAGSVRAGRVHIVQYFDPTTDAQGMTCRRSIGRVTAAELDRARSDLLAPLNRAIAATRRFGWDVVTRVAQHFRGHGYCAGADAWVTRLEQSLVSQGGRIDGRLLGTLHPNKFGQQAIADLVAPHLEQSLLHRTFPQPPPPPASASSEKELSVLATVAFALGAAFFVLAVGWLARRHIRLIESAGVVVLAAAGLALLVLALGQRDSENVGRELAIAAGAALGSGVLLSRLRLALRPGRPQLSEIQRRRATLAAAIVVAIGLAVGFVVFAGWHGLLLILGLAAGAAIAAGKPVTAPTPPASLVRTAAPVVLPLLAVVAIGTVKLPVYVAPLVGAVIAFVSTRWIVRPELKRNLLELEWVVDKVEQLVVVTLIVVVVAGALSQLVKPGILWLDERGGVPVALLFAAVVLWLLSIGMRLVSYATTWLRLAVAATIAVALVRGLMYLGVLPGHDALRRHVPALDTAVLILSAAVVVVVAGLEVLHRSRRARASKAAPVIEGVRAEALKRGRAQISSGLGLGTALVASVLVAAATIAGMVQAAGVGNDRLPPGTGDIRPEPHTPVIPGDDGELIEAYAPVLAFTEDERWPPIAVESYLNSRLAGTRMLGDHGEIEHPRKLTDLRKSCPAAAGSACWHLTIDCPEAKLRCAGGRFRKRGDFVRGGAAYARVLRSDRPPADGSGDVFAKVPKYLREQKLSALIQYWFFYRYNEWATHVLAGRLAQRHEGDWEAVVVGLAPDRPLFVAYSAHCGGTWRWWKDIRVSAVSSPWSHPLVASAEGSHANYPTAGPRSPNWTSCAGMPDGTAEALSFASNIRERTDYAWLWYPKHLIPVNASELPMSFPGTWGLNDRSVLENFSHHPASPSGGGPKTPTLQPLWRNPVPTVFCNRYWHGPKKLRC